VVDTLSPPTSLEAGSGYTGYSLYMGGLFSILWWMNGLLMVPISTSCLCLF